MLCDFSARRIHYYIFLCLQTAPSKVTNAATKPVSAHASEVKTHDATAPAAKNANGNSTVASTPVAQVIVGPSAEELAQREIARKKQAAEKAARIAEVPHFGFNLIIIDILLSYFEFAYY